MASTAKLQGATIAVSVAVHAAVAGALSWVALQSFAAESQGPRGDRPVGAALAGGSDPAVDLPLVGEGILLEEQPVDRTGETPRVAGGETVAHLDTGSPGRGGDGRVVAPALNLADRAERMRLSPDPMDRLDRDQLQRLRVARARHSWEDRRATTHPMELALLVTGAGMLIERRPASPREPSRGALESPAAGVRGSEVGFTPPTEDDAAGRRGGAQAGSVDGAPGVGVARARPGIDHRAAAPIGSARPDVARAAVSVPAIDSARPTDDIDSLQEVATTVRALVHASTSGGVAGQGKGGDSAAGEAAAGGASGAGARARPLGAGEDDIFDYWTTDPRLLPYFRKIHAKIDPLWAHAFPKSALLELKQGTVILEFTVSADGHVAVSWPPVRPSGIDEFDHNCAEAVRRANPLPPIPQELGVGSVRIRAPFVASNPIVK